MAQVKRHNAKGSWRRWLLIAAALAAVVAAASHLGPGVHSSARSALEQASATLLGAVQTAPLQLPPTRRLIADTPWYSNASSALQAFKSGLFGAVERAYHDIEAAAYQADAAKPIERLEPVNSRRWDLFNPLVPCPDGGALKRVGSSEDGGKWLCAETLEAPCVVYSIGSNGQYDWELAVLDTTVCEVHTFDCTYNGASQRPGRHFYHNICLGATSGTRNTGKGPAEFKSLGDITASLGHASVDLLKIDIEGFEYEIISGLGFADSCAFPLQLAIEIHYKLLYLGMGIHANRGVWDNMVWPMHQLSLGELALFFQHLADLGYAIISREDNNGWEPAQGCCSEYSFIRVERPAHCAASSSNSSATTAAPAANAAAAQRLRRRDLRQLNV